MVADYEEIEQAIRRVLAHIRIQPHETGIETILQMLADELSEVVAKRRRKT